MQTGDSGMLASYDYPCTGKSRLREPLVLLHGWGCDSRIWQSLLPRLNPHLSVICIDLPGFGGSASVCPHSEEQVLALLSAVLPERCTLMGWSLGGMLATAFAARFPERVNGLVTLAANACFSQREGWQCAMPAATFDEFYDFFQRQPAACLKRFQGLQARNDNQSTAVLKELRASFTVPEQQVAGWQQALQWLNRLDNRSALTALTLPGLHLFADGDCLVPATAGEAINTLNPQQKTVVLEQVGHALPISCPARLAELLLSFLDETRYRFDKARVAQSFGRAATRYDRSARLQRLVGDVLMQKLPSGREPRCIVDIGCGTGFFTRQLREKYPSAQVIGLDIADGMLRFARREATSVDHWLCADAEALPLADNSVDLLFSSLAFQWCDQVPKLVAELARVLAPGGVLAFSSLCDGTLEELRRAWSAVDGYVHVNRFVDSGLWQSSLSASGFQCQQLETVPEVLYYDEVRQLLRELKGIGAHNINSGQNPAMTGRRQLMTMIEAYESVRRDDGALPATWQVLYGLATG